MIQVREIILGHSAKLDKNGEKQKVRKLKKLSIIDVEKNSEYNKNWI